MNGYFVPLNCFRINWLKYNKSVHVGPFLHLKLNSKIKVLYFGKIYFSRKHLTFHNVTDVQMQFLYVTIISSIELQIVKFQRVKGTLDGTYQFPNLKTFSGN